MFAAHGAEVKIYDLAEAQRDVAVDYVMNNLPVLLNRRSGVVPSRVSAQADLAEAVHNAWLVIEAIAERLDLKKQAFGQLDELATKSGAGFYDDYRRPAEHRIVS
jgi:3-hydroxybutyryl-CoA dehydrogenase